MQNLSSKLETLNKVSEIVFSHESSATYVISIWDTRIVFSSDYKNSIARNAIQMIGAKSSMCANGFTTITFTLDDLTIEIVLT